jgi:hypothetical protein
MAQLIECAECCALMTAELLVHHEQRHAEASQQLLESVLHA